MVINNKKEFARTAWRWLLPIVLTASNLSAVAAERPVLSVLVVDDDGHLLPCRAWVDTAGQRLFEPREPETCTPYRRDRSFSCDGRFVIRVPAGRAVVHVERGKEYVPVDRPIVLAVGQTRELTVTLHRWINMPAEGWYSGDLHVHLGANDRRVLKQLALADDVHVTPAFIYWLRGTEPKWPAAWPNGNGLAEETIDRFHVMTWRNVEIERIQSKAVPGGSVGATFLFQLDQPVNADRYGRYFPTDTTLCLAARRHSPDAVIDTDKPSWAETVVGMALGAYDTVQVCHNHYHRSQTIAGGWGMIGPIEEGESNAAEGDGLFHRTNSLYYRFLNCGFRVGVSGGSAIGVMPVPMGYNRVYAQLDGPLTAKRYWTSVKAGRSFATSGPLLTMTVDDQPLGTTLDRTAADTSAVTVIARVRSIDQLESLQLVHDGQVVHEVDLSDVPSVPMLDHTSRWQVRPVRSGWLAARVLFRTPNGSLRQAHTSPVYVLIDKKPICHRRDAEYMILWIDRLVKVTALPNRFPTPADRQRVLDVYGTARSVYERLAADAERVWGD